MPRALSEFYPKTNAFSTDTTSPFLCRIRKVNESFFMSWVDKEGQLRYEKIVTPRWEKGSENNTPSYAIILETEKGDIFRWVPSYYTLYNFMRFAGLEDPWPSRRMKFLRMLKKYWNMFLGR